MIWFVGDGSARLEHERRTIAELADSVTWLRIVGWRLDVAGVWICLDADIVQSEEVCFPVTVRFPDFFPHSPPSVLPRGNLERCWSEHQYVTADGRPGELCLEYGPDNWTIDLTAADLLASAHRLLVGEDSEGDGPRPPIPSRHETTLGQELRSDGFRFVVTQGLAQFVQQLPSGVMVPATLQSSSQRTSFTVAVKTAAPDHGPTWTDPAVPDKLSAGQPGVIVRVGKEKDGIVTSASFSELCKALGRAGIDLYAWVEAREELSNFIVLAVDDHLAVRWRSSVSEDQLIAFKTIMAPDDGSKRISPRYRSLAKKTVALVGCGSAGSKIAVSLARSGVGHFVLVDDDVLLPGNLIRNDLDWHGIGGHKADALWERIKLVNPAATVEVRRIRLSAQASSGAAAAALARICASDLIVDATADPAVFNLLSSLVTSAAKPLVWLEVFGGGYGGLVARHRPGIDPNPQSMRAGILDYCARQGESWPKSVGYYGAAGDDGAPLIADDADVGVIAGNAARMVLDQLCGEEPRRFPHAAYLIGLSEGWCFMEPFDTRPIDVKPGEMSADRSADPAEKQAGLEFVKFLVSQLRDESADTN